jgi:hypothetical protein
MDEIIPWIIFWIITWLTVIGPGDKLGKNAGNADVEKAIADGLHGLVDVAVKDAEQPVAGWQQGLVERFAVLDQHVAIHPGRIEGQGRVMDENCQRRAAWPGFLG